MRNATLGKKIEAIQKGSEGSRPSDPPYIIYYYI